MVYGNAEITSDYSFLGMLIRSPLYGFVYS